MRITRVLPPVLLALSCVIAPARAQERRALTTADYDRAAKFLAPNLAGLMVGGTVAAHWLADGRFWYNSTTLAGVTPTIVDPANRTRAVAAADGKRAAFIRDWNLGVRDVATGLERQLTRDGVRNFRYATDNAGWAFSDRAILRWSPDSRKIAT